MDFYKKLTFSVLAFVFCFAVMIKLVEPVIERQLSILKQNADIPIVNLEFINVFNGDMSVVGPRPHMLSEDVMLTEKIDKYRLRYWVKPGITGLAAIKGFRGGTESLLLMQQRIDLDIKYIETWSIWLDIKICFLTAIETLMGSGKGD